MARLQGISGGMSGRTGSFTYRQSRGQTIVSQYQPIVKNPRTEGQNAQRARFKLMSQLAAVMAAGFGTMSVNKRPAKQTPTQRNAFVSLNMHLVEVDTSNQEVSAKIPMERLQLTSSNRAFGTITLDTAGVISIATNDTAISKARIVVVGYQTLGGIKTAYIAGITDAEFSQGQTSADIGDIAGEVVTGQEFTVLAYGLIPTSADAAVRLDNIHTPASSDFTSAIQLDALVRDGLLSETMTIGTNRVMAL